MASRLQNYCILAMNQAHNSCMDTKYGCIITLRDKIIAKGFNRILIPKKNSMSCILCSL
jgi:deoxycytidylate deaminase